MGDGIVTIISLAATRWRCGREVGRRDSHAALAPQPFERGIDDARLAAIRCNQDVVLLKATRFSRPSGPSGRIWRRHATSLHAYSLKPALSSRSCQGRMAHGPTPY